MFEFHGWAVVRVPDDDEASGEVVRRREEEAIGRVREALREADDDFSKFDVLRTGNGMIVLHAHGLRSRRYSPVVELFEWIAENLPDSYGLLYLLDWDRNEARVRRLARGSLEERDDPFLSPPIPTVEPPWEG